MRNSPGHLALVTPWDGADEDIRAHGGTVVAVVCFDACGLGPPAWHTSPTLVDAYGNEIAWDDRDLLPLGLPAADAHAEREAVTPNDAAPGGAALLGRDET